MADYYFNADTGDDSTGDGSSGSPWQTIDKANAEMSGFSSGDNLIFMGDTVNAYHGELLVDTAGITVTSDTVAYFIGATESIGDTGSWSSAGTNLWSQAASVRPWSIWFDNAGTTEVGRYTTSPAYNGDFYWSGSAVVLYCDSNPADRWDAYYHADCDYGIRVAANNVTVENILFEFYGRNDTMYYNTTERGAINIAAGTSNTIVQDCDIYDVDLGICANTTANYIDIINVNIYRVHSFTWPGGVGIAFHNDHVTVRGNSDTDRMVINMQTTRALNSAVKDNGEAIRMGIYDTASGYTNYFPDYCEIKWFDISHFNITGIKCHGFPSFVSGSPGHRDMESHKVHHGEIYDCMEVADSATDRDGIGYGSGDTDNRPGGVDIYNLVVHDIYHTGIKMCDYWRNSNIWNCLVYNVGYYADSIRSQGGIIFNQSINVYNCTVVDFHNLFGIRMGDSRGDSGSLIANCIVMSGAYAYSNNLASTDTNYNVIRDCMAYDYNSLYTGKAFDVYNMYTVDPLFANHSNRDYRLSGDSRAIDMGYDVSSVLTDDLDDNTRTLPYDIGAYEYVADDPTLPVDVEGFLDDGANDGSYYGTGAYWATYFGDYNYAGVVNSNTFDWCNFRIQMNIPQGVTISEAHLVVTPNHTSTVDIIARGEAADNATQITDANVATVRGNLTSASMSSTESFVDTVEHSIDITDIVQEIVNRSGWESGNYMQIFIEDDNNEAGEFLAVYDYSLGIDDISIQATYYETTVDLLAAINVVFEPEIREVVTTEETVGLAADADDGSLQNDSTWASHWGGYCYMGLIGGNTYDTNVRFVNVDIPQGANVTDAYFTSVCDLTRTADINVYGEDVDDAEQIVTTSDADWNAAIANLTTASESLSLSVTADEAFEVDVTDIVQEIVNRTGWEANNALQLFFFEDNNDSYVRFTGGDTTNTKLVVTYEAATNDVEMEATTTIAYSMSIGVTIVRALVGTIDNVLSAGGSIVASRSLGTSVDFDISSAISILNDRYMTSTVACDFDTDGIVTAMRDINAGVDFSIEGVLYVAIPDSTNMDATVVINGVTYCFMGRQGRNGLVVRY